MTNEIKKLKPKKKKQQSEYVVQQFQNHVGEHVRIGEIQLSSAVLGADELLSLVLGALRDKDVKKYIGIEERRKQAGTYVQ